ncbi:transglycosylase domain-containing protein [Proteinivorax hydrogeniformans]|uniref:Penicillin-binding protein 1A n=1 Tax=Proteinivorax hydrogeniformans TaxID=1826727 RepID=A0AAU8HSP5_9FIRM
MKIIRWIFRASIAVVLIAVLFVSYTYISIKVPFSSRYIDWENPKPIYDANREISIIEDVLVREFHANRIDFVSIDDMPEHLTKAFIAIEDNRFYRHPGFDVKGMMRALSVNIRNREITQGGSTITQQLARNLFLNHEQTAERKLLEIVIAFELERQFTKEQILEMYLNQIYFGSGNWGVEQASKNYFSGTSAKEVNLSQAAALAGIIQAPNVYGPAVQVNSQIAIDQRQIVLNRMLEKGFITNQELKNAVNKD